MKVHLLQGQITDKVVKIIKTKKDMFHRVASCNFTEKRHVRFLQRKAFSADTIANKPAPYWIAKIDESDDEGIFADCGQRSAVCKCSSKCILSEETILSISCVYHQIKSQYGGKFLAGVPHKFNQDSCGVK